MTRQITGADVSDVLTRVRDHRRGAGIDGVLTVAPVCHDGRSQKSPFAVACSSAKHFTASTSSHQMDAPWLFRNSCDSSSMASAAPVYSIETETALPGDTSAARRRLSAVCAATRSSIA